MERQLTPATERVPGGPAPARLAHSDQANATGLDAANTTAAPSGHADDRSGHAPQPTLARLAHRRPGRSTVRNARQDPRDDARPGGPDGHNERQRDNCPPHGMHCRRTPKRPGIPRRSHTVRESDRDCRHRDPCRLGARHQRTAPRRAAPAPWTSPPTPTASRAVHDHSPHPPSMRTPT